ncbi:hypothetical protein [Polyangium aurulentum]|uniref:hypothetical protein n=1 Tax=Polyangium aurulentum TaxID=2567896 RepID=UPI00146AF320|nr:hypothetical protein [Polyangium aurulentum]UQA58669.1 hypothetical protein E8A73_046790 [Polyangium aurulentum]
MIWKLIREILTLLWKLLRTVIRDRLKQVLRRLFFYTVLFAAVALVVVWIASWFY